ncbi:Prolyl-tRNA synthetase [Labilithrix luteola]|uniref:Proline--tRNA ligase n=1 Tax=Labilithrix luteola TaxID=1391654 RepID=A0A0K1Q1S3_9BACT|nr:proline--tRNA ligase [Labilithrix luteola]AKU99697.1 Prolyl-tRNA synthetase [Labilithrix luteola]
MLYSRALIPTVKEAPADAANASHTLLVRGGYIRKVGAGMYDFLPLGLRVLKKVEAIVREEMDRSGAQEILMPALLPAEYYKETGRWDLYGDTLFRLKDRKGGEFHLGPTHEEIVTDIARREIKSWRDLPMNLYQIQNKFRDEPRPRGGLLRGREFLMKDAYSFDVSEEAAFDSYETMRKAYCRIFDRMGLVYRMVAADPGAIGGSTSAEFQVLADSGEDAIVACDTCDYAANVEIATVKVKDQTESSEALEEKKKVHTPKVGTIEDVSKFLSTPKERFLKSLVYTTGKDVVMAVVRGDHDVNEIRLARALGVDEVFLATDADVQKATGAAVGFAGPVGFKGKVVVDRAAALVKNAATGANETDHHFTGVNKGRDWDGEVADIRLATSGDPCPNCEGGHLKTYRGIEGGHIFILGTKYSAAMGAMYSDEKQEKKPIVMGCYGIGVSRLVATAIEQNNDADGIKWPMSLAPYHVHLVTIGKEENVHAAAKKIYDELREKGVDVLWDDRDERPGVKFKDADLLGMPLRVTIGAKGLANGNIEVKPRTEPDPKKAELVPVENAVKVLADRVHAALGK